MIIYRIHYKTVYLTRSAGNILSEAISPIWFFVLKLPSSANHGVDGILLAVDKCLVLAIQRLRGTLCILSLLAWRNYLGKFSRVDYLQTGIAWDHISK